MRRKHFAVRVDIDALPLGLLEKLLEIQQVMSGNNNGRTFFCANRDSGRHGVPKMIRMRPVKKLKTLEIHHAEFHIDPYKIIHGQTAIRGGTQTLMEKRGHGFILPPQHERVIGIGRHSLKTVEKKFAQASDILANATIRENADLTALVQKSRKIFRGFPVSRGRKLSVKIIPNLLFVSFQKIHFDLFLDRVSLPEAALEPCGVKIHIRDCGKKRFDHKKIRISVPDPHLAGHMRVNRDPFCRVDQEVLQRCHFRCFAANSQIVTPFALRCLFTLKAEHAHKLPPGFLFCCLSFDKRFHLLPFSKVSWFIFNGDSEK